MVLRRTVMVCVAGLTTSLLSAGQVTPRVPAAPSAPAPAAPPAAPAPPAPAAAPANGTTPEQRAEATPKGQLKNPYSDTDAAVVESGGQLFLKYACSGCHGGTGGGGMCPPLTN